LLCAEHSADAPRDASARLRPDRPRRATRIRLAGRRQATPGGIGLAGITSKPARWRIAGRPTPIAGALDRFNGETGATARVCAQGQRGGPPDENQCAEEASLEKRSRTSAWPLPGSPPRWSRGPTRPASLIEMWVVVGPGRLGRANSTIRGLDPEVSSAKLPRSDRTGCSLPCDIRCASK